MRANEVLADLHSTVAYYNHAAKFQIADARAKFAPGVLHYNMKLVEDRAYHESVIVAKAVRAE